MSKQFLDLNGLTTYTELVKEYIEDHTTENAQADWTESDSTKQSYINHKPTLGTASAKDVPTSGNASSSQVVMGNDSRLTDSRTPKSHTHTKSEITDFPTLGTASAKNVPSSGNASSTEVVLGSDTRLSDARSASDVYSWAKASSKPTYTASEVGLGNVGNFKAVSTVASQGLTSTEQSNARANIGAGTSSFSGSYNDLSNKPTLGTAAAKAFTTSVTSGSADLVTSGAVYTAIDNLPEPMIFKGSLGTGGTITELPSATSSNTGYTYKVITAGTYASQAAKVGDTFISEGSAWVLIPSGDEPSGTVTSVTIKATSPIAIDSSSAITTSGTRTLSHANSGVTAGTYQSVTVNATGHVTAGSALTKAQVTTALGYTPPTTDTNTTYTIGTNGNNITLTPSSGSAQSITAPYATVSSYSDNITITEKESTGGMEVGFPLHVGNVQASSGVTYGTLGKEKYTGVAYHFKDGTASAIGEGALILGNGYPKGTAGNKVGWLCLWGEWSGYAQLGYVGLATSGVTKHYLPNTGGTLINSATYTDYTVTKTGSGASGNWGISISGNAATATTATSATKATQDESGNNIKASYASSFSISDHTITLENKNGASLGTVTVPDENVSVTSSNPTTAETCFIPWVSDLGTQTLKVNNGCRISVLNGTTSEAGLSQLTLGNSTASGTANNKRGNLRLYGRNTGYGQIVYDTTTTNTTHTLPSTTGIILNTGTTSFTQTLTSGTKIGTIKINNTSTDIYAPTTSSSSRKIKKNIQAINDEEINKILQLNAVKFDFKESSTNNADHRGFIAEEVAELLPNLTTDEIVDDNGNLVTPMQLNYMEMIPYLVEICKKQQKEIDQLKKIL